HVQHPFNLKRCGTKPGTLQKRVPGRLASSRTAAADSAVWPSMLVARSEEHTSELQSRFDLVCRLLLEKKKIKYLIMCVCNISLTSSLLRSLLTISLSHTTNTATPSISTLSLHDALPISCPTSFQLKKMRHKTRDASEEGAG